ncbi:MAG: hypothetical protein JXR65_09490 [Bacteroidales bacterium]|nr:hypothetical protein [Bacteroidales bacterium]
MENKLSRILSVLLHPLLVPTWFLVVLSTIPELKYSLFTMHYQLIFGGFIFVLTFILPVIIMLVLRLTGLVRSLQLVERNERMIPILMTTFIYFITFYVLNKPEIQGFRVFSLFMLGSSVLLLAAFSLNYFTKVSLHLTAWGGFTGALIGLSFLFSLNLFFWIFLVLLLSGVTAYTRLENNAHSPFQIYLGYLTGFVIMLFLFMFV